MQVNTLHQSYRRPLPAQPDAERPDLPRPRRHVLRRLTAMIGIGVVLSVWQIVTMLELYPAFIIPPPLDVARKFISVIVDGTLLHHATVTVSEILAGLGVAAFVGVTLGYLLAKSQGFERALSPLIVGFQSTPVVAYAPLLVIWFGTGTTSKIIICALIAFFPLMMNTLIGVRNIPLEQREIMRLYAASPWQMFAKLEVPAALTVLFGGLKVSATLAVIGAVVGEFVGASAGLGALIMLARSQFDTPLVFVAVLSLALIARTIYGVLTWIEARLLRWQRRDS
ncbi:MAG: ABC transporter permease [Chloroflexota bacterium]|nr:ABC transporter permease [Chloroflexota bacterium]